MEGDLIFDRQKARVSVSFSENSVRFVRASYGEALFLILFFFLLSQKAFFDLSVSTVFLRDVV
jgi:hypothetical protein